PELFAEGIPHARQLQKHRELGLDHVEGWDGHFPLVMDLRELESYKGLLKANGVRLAAYGVVGFGGDRDANRRVFNFARAMRIPTLTADPAPDSFDQLNDLVREFRVNVAIHNHGPGSRYDQPESIYQALRGRDRRIGACVDTGHFLRSNVDPVEVVEKLGNRVYSIHLKDVRTVNGRKEFTELGKGDLDLDRLYRTLRRIRYRGLLALEYEEHPKNPMPYIRESLQAWQKAITARK
ncbi:MAG: sugar phosphate isomerase/epimerase, partial [Armatimonadetes bacterium]|nr:sugar phosphate isomerase/epimerase [Armatimonadota bacterium]